MQIKWPRRDSNSHELSSTNFEFVLSTSSITWPKNSSLLLTLNKLLKDEIIQIGTTPKAGDEIFIVTDDSLEQNFLYLILDTFDSF